MHWYTEVYCTLDRRAEAAREGAGGDLAEAVGAALRVAPRAADARRNARGRAEAGPAADAHVVMEGGAAGGAPHGEVVRTRRACAQRPRGLRLREWEGRQGS